MTIWIGSLGSGGCGIASGSCFGISASSFTCRSGVTTMKMMSSTSTTSTRGVTLMSFLGPLLADACILLLRPGEEVDDLRLDGVHVGLKVFDAPVEVVVDPHRRDGDQEAER